ncbi:mucin-19 isoform X1 [Drosophila mauritiana]|uniref:Mucin-19 isoform X1 n=1 Tax=Drosophila mauritiana TaxID=7226 RepID=A0A6P8KQN3_DROMA|nr:mucin-19 isoform X1 [Drosophila mauritiana]
MASEDVQITSVIDANGQSLPLHGNSLGGPLGPPVKQERPDDAEIRELAAKMKEQQKQQAAQQASRQAAMQHSNGGAIAASSAGGNMQPPITNGNGQTNIMNYLSRHQKLPNGTMQVVPALASNGRSNGAVNDSGSDKKSSTGPCDEESIQGHFGWAQFGKVSIPYIYRQSEKYCSVRMIELKLLGKYLNCLHPDIYSSCTCVRSYYITDAEARLFIEINHKHCDGEFGRDIFNQKDLVVRLSDASKFYQFLDICYRKLVSGSKTPSEKCGFIRINKESVVPYTVRNNQQVVPLFYFEGETENLKTKAELLNGWDLAYLKFCCKVQGIRNELFSSENVAVISLTDIKSYFPNGTEFEDYWPSKVVDSNLLIGNRANVNNSVNWTRQPSAPPPKVTTSVSGSSGPSSSSGGNMGQNTSSASSSANTAGGQQVTSKSQQQHAASAAAAAATAHQQHLMKQRAAAAAAAAGANGVANAANSFGAAAVAAFNSQAAAAASMLQQSQGNNRMLSQATVQALASSGWMSGQTNLQLHAQMMAQQTHANANRVGSYREHMNNLMMSGSSRQPYSYNSPAISMSSVNNHSGGGGNAPPPLVRSAAGQNANHMSNVEQSMVQQQQQQTQQQQPQQQQRHQNSTFNNHNNNHAPQQHSSPNSQTNSSHHHHHQQQPQHALAKSLSSSNNNSSGNSSSNNTRNSNSSNNSSSAAAVAAAAAAGYVQALLGGGGGAGGVAGGAGAGSNAFNYNLPSTRADYTNLALWNQLTPAQRLLISQQLKGATPNGSGGNITSGTASSHAAGKQNFPALPSLPLDTDLITMLDYNNPNKANKSQKSAGGVTFTKPIVPPLIPDVSGAEITLTKSRRAGGGDGGGGGGGGGVAAAGSGTTIPLNSTQALEDFEKKFTVMTDEMRAVIQKVLANPDLSTFIQTNSGSNNSANQNHLVPSYISPPMSPSVGGLNMGMAMSNVATLTLASNPNVTITPQLPGHFLHSPSSSCSSSSASNTAPSPLSSGGGGGGSGGAGGAGGASSGATGRQKSVICSTKSNNLPMAILSLASNNSGGVSSNSGVRRNNNNTNSNYGRQTHSQSSSNHSNTQTTSTQQQSTPTDVIDLSSSRRSLAASAAYLQQHSSAVAQQQVAAAAVAQQQRLAAVAAHHAQQNGRSSSNSSNSGNSANASGNNNGTSNSGSSGNGSNGNGNASSNSASMHLQRHAALAHAAAAANAADSAQRLCVIPEIPTNNMNLTPYKVLKVCVDKHLVPCINMKAYNESEQLMTLIEFQKNFFPSVPLDHCKRLIEALGVELYKANRRQVQILMEYDRNYNENMPLVQVRDIIKYMTQLTFMTRQSEQPPAKRTRTS